MNVASVLLICYFVILFVVHVGKLLFNEVGTAAAIGGVFGKSLQIAIFVILIHYSGGWQ